MQQNGFLCITHDACFTILNNTTFVLTLKAAAPCGVAAAAAACLKQVGALPGAHAVP
jgi:hypothetical protein